MSIFGGRRLMWLMVWVAMSVTSCSAQAPIPVSQLPAFEGRQVTVAGAIVAQADRLLLVSHVVTMPDVPVQFGTTQYALELSWVQQQLLPWREDGAVRYVPAIVTGEFRNGRIENVSGVDTDMREQTVVNHEMHRMIRLVGHLHSHPDGTYIHDQYQPDQSRGFWPAWVGDMAPLRMVEGAEVLVEGVRVDERIIAVVIAPVIEKVP